MLAYALAIVVASMAVFAVMVCFALIVKVWSVNPEELKEVQRAQDGVIGLFTGRLKNLPNESGDFRIVRGLRWDRKTGQYESQSALSSEGFRAAFPK